MRPESNSPSPAQRQVQAGAQKTKFLSNYGAVNKFSSHNRNKNQNMQKIISGIGLGCFILMSTAVAPRAEDAGTKVEDTPSYKHFTETGSFFTGKKLTTWQDFPDVTTAIAFKRAYAYIAKSEYSIVSSDKDMGVISAVRTVTRSEEHTSELQSLRHLVCR